MKRSLIALTLIVPGALLAGASCADVECYGTLCVSPSSADGGAGGEGGIPDVAPPKDCDENADAKDAPNCAVNAFALFVDPDGKADNPGTREAPLKSIQAALTQAPNKGLRRIYVCGVGPFNEHLKPTAATSIFGGFACGTWTYAGIKAKVAPTSPGYVLHLDAITSNVRVSDLELVAPDAPTVDPPSGASSIAIFANGSNLKVLRSSVTAGNAAAGAPGKDGSTATLTAVSSGSMNFNGNMATGTTRGDDKICTCSNSGMIKSAGGAGGGPNAGGVAGGPGSAGGAAGMAGSACNGLGKGQDGANTAASGAPATAITTRGVLEVSGWVPSKGNDATEHGAPGYGGGGGAGGTTGAGGGGACGGCSGTPGLGGQGGGASIAVLSFSSTLSLVESTLVSKNGGTGGKGGSGGAGGIGGTNPGAGGGNGCPGGLGGKGGDGGAGGGGAGGLSIGVLYSGTVPEVDPSAITIGTEGTAGPEGSAGANNAGPAGIKEAVKDVATL